MSEILVFEQIKNRDIFETEYSNLLTTGNASIEFKMQTQANGGIVAIYAPNGTGKTSLSEVLANESDSTDKMFVANYNERQITGADKKFHVIKDQLNRHVIPGDTSDYLIGANIHREYELKKKIAEEFSTVFSQLPKVFKTEYKVTKIGDYLIGRLTNNDAARYIKDILPTRNRGKHIEHHEFIQFISNTTQINLQDSADTDKMNFIINDCAGAKLIEKILGISLEQFVINAEIATIEQNDDAIGVLKKYKYLQTCIVCDNEDFNAESLLERKKESRKRIYESLDSKTKDLLDKVINDNSLRNADPFDIKNMITAFISNGDGDIIQKLQEEINLNISYIVNRMTNTLLNCFEGTTMLRDFEEYSALLETQPEIDSEELLFIQEVISENIGPEITIVRDEDNDKNFKLMLADQEFLGVEREKLHLSNGEQNFISLAFELLLARKSDREFIVMDDPISSFDSVYKNKIAFCIVKFLENKKQIILTHNTDLIRLLEVQQNGCFNLYMLNNTNGGKNGFIRVNNLEKEILINLYKLIKLFQNQDGILSQNIRDERKFLMSMIPFMRGYAHICKDGDAIYTALSGVMHGYETASVDVTDIYEKLFGYRFTNVYTVSVNDILDLDCANIDILDNTQYPLLAETLRQTLVYYYLRMKVEKELVDIFSMQINLNRPPMLNQIIRKTLNYILTDDDADKKRDYKVFFTSRKTLLNEFNHFEGNMNIFQPAIDIEANALQREIDSIEAKLVQLRTDYA
ncbi:MAG: AAA family ATPase [Pelosinus sp.]|nr:AAA family ATPase [Pelosinus sp.]